MKWSCLLLAIVSVAAAIALTQNVSFAQGSVTAKPWSFGVAQTQLLVDSGQSPLADSAVLTQDIDLLAGDLGELMGSPTVLGPVSRAMGVPESKISAQAQIVGDVAVDQTEAREAQAANQLLDAGRGYSILARVDESTFVVQLYTQAPTAAKAIRMANIAAGALRGYIAGLVSSERIAKRRSVILRQVEPAFGGTTDRDLAWSVAVLIAIAIFVFGLVALFTMRRWRALWRQHVTP